MKFSIVDTMIGLLRAISTQYFELNEIPTRRGCAVSGVVSHNIYKCKDGWIMVTCFDTSQGLKFIVCQEMKVNPKKYMPKGGKIF